MIIRPREKPNKYRIWAGKSAENGQFIVFVKCHGIKPTKQ